MHLNSNNCQKCVSGRRKSIYRISPSPPKNLLSAPSEREVSTIASSYSDLRTNKSSTKLEPLALICSMGKQRITKSTNGSKREAALRSCHSGRAINRTKGKRRSARLILTGPVTRSHSKMNNIGTPQKSPRKHQVKGLSQPKPPPAVWSQENEEHLIFILLGFAQKGVRPSFGSHVNKITDDLNNRIDNCRYSTRQVTNKIGGLKQCHKNFTMLLSGKVGAGFGWDHTTNTITNSEDKWEQLKFEYGADKYYKFKYNPPRLFPLLTSIFAGSYATGELAHASTQDLPDTDDERSFDNPLLDLNNPCAVIDLEELDMPRVVIRMPPNKGKRRATPLNSSQSSKRTNTTTEDLEVGKMSGEWSEMKREFDLLNCKLRTAKGSSATSKPNVIAEAMVVLNDVVAEHPVTEENYWRADNSFTDRTKARVFIGMDPIKRVGWVM